MQNRINCPNCHTPYVADIPQIIDVGEQPELKRMLLSGRLNTATCPNCQAGVQLVTPLLYHDPAHELFMVFVPMELNLPHVEQQKLIGELVRQVMDKMPAEKRRAYMLQPLTIINMQTLLEKVLETEGITPEMMARQRQQGELLQILATADNDVVEILLKNRANEIDGAFLAMLESALQQTLQTEDEKQILRLTNLQARLYRTTEVGKKALRQKTAIQRFQKEAQKQGGLSVELLMKHILANKDDDEVIAGIAQMTQGGLNSQFFHGLADEISKAETAGDTATAAQLKQHQDMFREAQEAAQAESRQIMEAASKTLQAILSAEDPRQVIRDNMENIDDGFMFLLNNTITQAEGAGNQDQANVLRQVQMLISREMESQLPPEIRFVNAIASLQSVAEQNAFLDQNRDMVSPEMVDLLGRAAAQTRESGDEDFAGHLEDIAHLMQGRL
jgi:hypothetical protein